MGIILIFFFYEQKDLEDFYMNYLCMITVEKDIREGKIIMYMIEYVF